MPNTVISKLLTCLRRGLLRFARQQTPTTAISRCGKPNCHSASRVSANRFYHRAVSVECSLARHPLFGCAWLVCCSSHRSLKASLHRDHQPPCFTRFYLLLYLFLCFLANVNVLRYVCYMLSAVRLLSVCLWRC